MPEKLWYACKLEIDRNGTKMEIKFNFSPSGYPDRSVVVDHALLWDHIKWNDKVIDVQFQPNDKPRVSL